MSAQITLSDDKIELLIDTLGEIIEKQNAKLVISNAEGFLFFQFFTKHKNSKQLIKEFVEFVFGNREPKDSSKFEIETKAIKEACAGFHDEHLDLSKIPCTGDMFQSW